MKNYRDLDKRIAGLRKDYSFGTLTEHECAKNPHSQFVRWFEQALKARVNAVNAAAVSTCGRRKPSVRIVLVKGFDAKEFVFYTSYESRKARDIQENPRAEMLFYWAEAERQVRISGKITKISSARSDAYFAGRPRNAQIGAWASHQSFPVTNRQALEKLIQKFKKKFKDKPISRPKSWGGYALVPDAYEFWQGRASRLNDRILYEKSGKRWKRRRLQP